MDPGKFVQSSRALNPLESGIRRGKNFLGSIVGAVIGLLLFFLVAPGLIFMSEFQYTAENLAQATPAAIDSPATGYVYLWGKPVLSSANPCLALTDKQCVYYSYMKEEYLEKTGVKCGRDATNAGVTKVSDAPEKCKTETVRRGGKDYEERVCEKCINAKWHQWDIIESKVSSPVFKIGANTIDPRSATVKAPTEHVGADPGVANFFGQLLQSLPVRGVVPGKELPALAGSII